jgi:hypothetical protein
MQMVLVATIEDGKLVMVPDGEREDVEEVFVEEIDNREVVQDGDDWVRRKKDTGEVVDRYSFDISNWRKSEMWGDYEAEPDKSDLFLLGEGVQFSDVYGYEPAYRDISTGILVFKRNRELTDKQRATARSFQASAGDVEKGKSTMRRHLPYLSVGEFCGA